MPADWSKGRGELQGRARRRAAELGDRDAHTPPSKPKDPRGNGSNPVR